MIDKNQFFREATLRICGSLEITDALVNSTRYLREHMPVDKVFLQIFEPESNAMRLVAIASSSDGEIVNRMVPLSAGAIDEMWGFAEDLQRQDFQHVWFFGSNPCEQLLTREIARSQGFTPTSLMVMSLGITDPPELVGKGSIVLLTEGEKRFERRHADLLALLRKPCAIAFSNILRHQEAVRLRDRLADDNRYFNRELLRVSGDEIIGADFGLREVMHQVQHVAATDTPVLLTGETGAGKDVIANAIHLNSSRRNGPFIPVNCGAIPDSLIDSELFGHEKGAFSGALAMKRGRFERAEGGTILLDEIGEMPLDAQVRLLRVLQHREVERVGGTDRIPVDIRIIAATNQDLHEMVRDGKFREDLLFRLNVFPITVPPLRERLEDVPALLRFFMEKKAKELKIRREPALAPGAMEALMAYGWPGNVRELENVVERAMILCQGQDIRFDELDATPRERPVQPSPDDVMPMDLDSFIANHIRRVLEKTDGKIHGPGGAGELLGVNPNTLRYKMRKLGIPFRKGGR